MFAGCFPFLARDRVVGSSTEACSAGSGVSIFCLFARRVGGTLGVSSVLSGLGTRGDAALRLRDLGGDSVGWDELEATAAVESAASLAAERVTLEDMRS